ncbi:uridylate kinase [Candidatus Mycoplasma haematominutum]|uniref:amino acid kinase family protein n=1 Tax=Candidatus Mycoplasma haematominutum TaxID=209446 RepID=UPI0002F59102|nr:uridylate kinase [Candidatus Mycoplasma haematominutum]
MKKPRLLLKLSGGAVCGTEDIYSEQKLISLAIQIRELSQNYLIGIVIGGGNIWRGKEEKLSFLSVHERDYIGMISTVMNGFVLEKALKSLGVATKLFSALEIERVTARYDITLIDKLINSGEVLIFAGGLGEPQFSTDSAAIIRAIEIGASQILIGKEGVSGIYNKDPNVFSDATFYSELSYDQLIRENIQVLDQASLQLAKKNNLKLLVFNQEVENCFIKALNREIPLSEVS